MRRARETPKAALHLPPKSLPPREVLAAAANLSTAVAVGVDCPDPFPHRTDGDGERRGGWTGRRGAVRHVPGGAARCWRTFPAGGFGPEILSPARRAAPPTTTSEAKHASRAPSPPNRTASGPLCCASVGASNRSCAEMDVRKQLGNMRIPHAVRAPGPAAGVLSRRRFAVHVAARKIHAPHVAVVRRQRPAITRREPVHPRPGQ